MEENEYNAPSLNLDGQGQQFLHGAARWARFLAIAHLIFSAITILMALTAPLWFGTLRNAPGAKMTGMLAMGSGVFMFSYLFGGVIGLIFALMLLRFANRALSALARGGGQALNQSFTALNAYFRAQGILVIVALIFVSLALIIAVIGAGAMMMM